MKIKLIADGSSRWEWFIRRWGISFLIGEDTIFDTFGDAGVFLENIRRFNVDIDKIRRIIISHDHWDHISGLWYLIGRRKDVTVYICPGFKEEIKNSIKSFGVGLVEASEGLFIKEDIYSTGELCMSCQGRLIYEQSLVIKSRKGLAIIAGCAHAGIIDIVGKVREKFNEDIYLVAGGLHLKDRPIKQIEEVVSGLKSFGVESVAPLHCTGEAACRLLKHVYGDNYIRMRPAESLEL